MIINGMREARQNKKKAILGALKPVFYKNGFFFQT
jgi:hypothetical protein